MKSTIRWVMSFVLAVVAIVVTGHVLPAATVVIDGHHIRPHTTVLIPIHHIHHDERWWPNPETFDPTRFIGDAVKDRPRSAYLPFGGGRRICIGQSFALMEMVLMAAVMSQRFTFDVCPDHAVELEATLTLRPRHGLRVVAHRREQPADARSTG